MNDQTTAPPIGHNAIANLTSVLSEQFSALQADVGRMLVRLREAPAICEDDQTSGRLSDLYKDADALMKRVEKIRVSEKEPFLEGGRKVDSFFNSLGDSVGKQAREVGNRVTGYLVAKKERADREAAEKARLARQQEEERIRAARKAEEDAAAAAADAERRRSADKKAGDLAAARGHEAARDVHLSAATQAGAVAEQHEATLAAPAADKSRTRGQSSLATLREEMTFEVFDWSAIDLETLRPYIERAALEKAIKGRMRQLGEAALDGGGTSALAGVRFFKKPKGHFR